MNTSKIITFLFCFIIPIDSICMVIKAPQLKKKPLQELIQNLKINKPINITEFLNSLDDAKKQNLKIYLIAKECFNTLDPNDKKNIETLFQKSISNINAFKNEKNAIFFQAHEIPAGFICLLVDGDLYKKEKNIPVILTKLARPKTINDKLDRLGIFNIKGTIDDLDDKKIKEIETFLFPIETNVQLETLYAIIMAENKRVQKAIQEIAQAKETIPSVALQPEKEIIPEPITEIVKSEEEKAKEQEQQQKQTTLAQKYKPTLELIDTMGKIPQELKNKANQFVVKLEKGSLDQSEVIQAQAFFKDLEKKVKEIEEEAKIFPFMDLITRLQKNDTITISDFLRYLDDAKKNNFYFYFIPIKLINSLPEKNKFLALLHLNESQPEIFNNQNDTILLRTYPIVDAFICLINKNLYINLSDSPTIFVEQGIKRRSIEDKLDLLKAFNIIKNPNYDKDNIIKQIKNPDIIDFSLSINTELTDLYDAVLSEIEKVKELIEQQEVTEPEKEIKKKSGIESLDIYEIIIPPLKTPKRQKKQKQILGGHSSGE